MAQNVETLLIELDSTTAKLREEVRKAEGAVSGAERKINRSTRLIDRGFDRVSRAAGRMGRTIVGAVKSVFSLRGALTAVAGVTGAALAIERTVDSVNNLAKAAKTADVTAESIQELTFAFGQLTDITDQGVNMALQRFSRRMGLAIDGTGAAKDTFGELGIELQDVNGNIRDTETVLDETLRSLASMESDTLRAAKASEVFGEDAGPRLAAALAGGIEGMDEARKQARDLGLVLSNDTVAGAEELADEFRILQQRVLKNFQRAILENKESILELVQALGEAITKLGEFAAGLRAYSDRKKFESNKEEIEETRDLLFELINTQKRLQQELPENFDRSKVISVIGMSLDELDKKITKTRNNLFRLTNEALFGPPAGGSPDRDTGDGTDTGGGAATTTDVASMFAGPAEAGNLTIEQMEILYKRAQKASEEANDSMQDDARSTASELENVTKEQERMRNAANDLGLSFSSAFEEAAIEGENLRGVLQGLAEDIQRIILRRTVTEPLAGAVSDILFSAMTSSGGGADTVTNASGTKMGIPSSATGNVFNSPSITSIAEGGKSEAVLPLEWRDGKLGVRMSGGGGNVYNIDATGADQAAVVRLERLFDGMDANFEDRANAAVVDDSSRGGALRGAIG